MLIVENVINPIYILILLLAQSLLLNSCSILNRTGLFNIWPFPVKINVNCQLTRSVSCEAEKDILTEKSDFMSLSD